MAIHDCPRRTRELASIFYFSPHESEFPRSRAISQDCEMGSAEGGPARATGMAALSFLAREGMTVAL